MGDYQIPDDCRYSREDEWARQEGDVVTIGVTDYAQDQLGDIVFVELPEVGSAAIAGEAFGVIESVKAVSDLFAPISGAISAVNETLVDEPESVNQDCYGKGWILQIRPSDPSELEQLMASSGYHRYVAERADAE